MTLLEHIQGTVEGLKTLEVGVNSTPLYMPCDLVLYTALTLFKRWTTSKVTQLLTLDFYQICFFYSCPEGT